MLIVYIPIALALLLYFITLVNIDTLQNLDAYDLAHRKTNAHRPIQQVDSLLIVNIGRVRDEAPVDGVSDPAALSDAGVAGRNKKELTPSFVERHRQWPST